MAVTDGDRTLRLMKAWVSFALGGFLTEISCPWLANTDCVWFYFLKPECLFLREKFRCRVWEYDFIAIHVVSSVFVLRIETVSILELVTGPVLSQLDDVTGLICMNVVLQTYLWTCTSLYKGL